MQRTESHVDRRIKIGTSATHTAMVTIRVNMPMRGKAMPKRIQRKRTKGWRLPHGATCVTRPGKWGNPFSTADAFRIAVHQQLNNGCVTVGWCRAEDAEKIAVIVRDIEQLQGFDLACWCSIDHDCHADVLLTLANRTSAEPNVEGEK